MPARTLNPRISNALVKVLHDIVSIFSLPKPTCIDLVVSARQEDGRLVVSFALPEAMRLVPPRNSPLTYGEFGSAQGFNKGWERGVHLSYSYVPEKECTVSVYTDRYQRFIFEILLGCLDVADRIFIEGQFALIFKKWENNEAAEHSQTFQVKQWFLYWNLQRILNAIADIAKQ